jgi:DNA-binding transcriptional regulator GbsR (MarR family)
MSFIFRRFASQNNKTINMFNTKLKKQVKELESRIEFQTRWNNEIYRLLERVCKRLDTLEILESER